MVKNAAFRTGCVRDCTTSATKKATTCDSYNLAHPTNNTGATQTCELDHLVPLEIGGANTLDNIWPQCGPKNVALAKRYFKQKDMVETRTNSPETRTPSTWNGGHGFFEKLENCAAMMAL